MKERLPTCRFTLQYMKPTIQVDPTRPLMAMAELMYCVAVHCACSAGKDLLASMTAESSGLKKKKKKGPRGMPQPHCRKVLE